MRRVFCLFFILLAPCLSLLQPSQAQERMRIAWAGSTPSNTPIWVADQKGFFKKNGLNAEVIAISASTIVIQALLTGEVDFIIAPSATLVTSRPRRRGHSDGLHQLAAVHRSHCFSRQHLERGAAQGQDRRRKPFGNNIGHDSPSRFAPLGSRSREGDQDHRHRRESATIGRSGQQSSPSSPSSANRW